MSKVIRIDDFDINNLEELRKIINKRKPELTKQQLKDNLLIGMAIYHFLNFYRELEKDPK